MKKYQYQINDRVIIYDNGDWIIPGTITAIDDGLYCVEYDNGNYDWLIYDELHPSQYNVGDYVRTPMGIGKIKKIEPEWGLITVSYGKLCVPHCYYEYELNPAPKPSFLARLFGKGVCLYV